MLLHIEARYTIIKFIYLYYYVDVVHKDERTLEKSKPWLFHFPSAVGDWLGNLSLQLWFQLYQE